MLEAGRGRGSIRPLQCPYPPGAVAMMLRLQRTDDTMTTNLETTGWRIVESRRTERPRYGMAADGYTLRSGAPTSLVVRIAVLRA